MKNVKGFNGVFSIDTLPEKIKPFESGIINYDSRTGKGTHWVCYYNHPKYDFVEFFDSFGLAPGENIKKFLSSSNKKIVYQDNQLQMNSSELCGYYCMKYIKERNKGREPLDVVYSFKQKPCLFNEKRI